MMQSATIRPDACGRVRRDISILDLIEWAFQRECASLDFNEMATTAGERPQVSPLWMLIEQRRVGCKPDGGGRSDPHPDADIVASALAALPASRGGRDMGITIAEMARAGQRPDWMPSAKTKCVPVGLHKGRHGTYAKSERCGQIEVVSRGRKRVVEVRWCPVRFINTQDRIEAARREYVRWWCALEELRNSFQLYGGLTAWRVTDAMPPRSPWIKG